MAFRALLFSKSEETNAALTSACKTTGIRLEVCSDIFSAIEKGTKQFFSAVLADWSDQPEAGFLLKRARESSPNKSLVAIAIVDHEPTATEMRDHNLELLIYSPIEATEAQDVLAKAAEKMQHVNPETEASGSAVQQADDATFSAAAAASQDQSQDSYQLNEDAPADLPAPESGGDDSAADAVEDEPATRLHSFPFRKVAAIALALVTAFFLWNAHDTILYLARTREGRIKVLKESLAALFYLDSSATTPVISAGSDARQDSYFSRTTPSSSVAQSPQIAVISTEAELTELPARSPRPADFPLPTPIYEVAAPPPVHVQRGEVPDSLRGSAPITRPVVVAVSPAQMMPVSMPTPAPLPEQVSEPVPLSEDAARALLVQTVNPSYPPEAAAQKLHGPVVLQATIGRDGSVEDLKILRGSFILAKAAIAAVKQWRFQPYTLNGHAAQTQTVLTINFGVPAS